MTVLAAGGLCSLPSVRFYEYLYTSYAVRSLLEQESYGLINWSYAPMDSQTVLAGAY